MVSREEVRWAYIMLLGREPESEMAYQTHITHHNLESLRLSMLRSEEGLGRIRNKLGDLVAQAPIADGRWPFDYEQSLTVHLHIEKTGGTFLYDILRSTFRGRTITPPHMPDIPSYTMRELNRFDLISGHFTLGEALALPRRRKTIICAFREPRARLVSFYRFHRAHPRQMRSDPFVRIAQDHDPVGFFTHPEIRTSRRLFNLYVHILAGTPQVMGAGQEESLIHATDIAIGRLADLAAVGMTEDMPNMIEQVRGAIGLELTAPAAPVHSTDEIGRQAGFQAVPPVEMTDALHAALQPLVEYDVAIYEAVQQLSVRRVEALRQSVDRSAMAGPDARVLA
jgi:hypothetical protein